MVSRYQHRISGPFLDRVDIFIEVPHIDYEKLAADRLSEKSEAVQRRVVAARAVQPTRLAGTRLRYSPDAGPRPYRTLVGLSFKNSFA